VRIAPRFVGPFPGFANGGIIAGTLARQLPPPEGVVEVRLQRPVPVDVDLVLEARGEQRLLLRGADVLATARRGGDRSEAAPPVAPEAARRTEPVVRPEDHMAPGCFVCGHEHPSGYHLQPGRVAGRPEVAALWTPPADLAEVDGTLSTPLVWAALDCPSWFGGADGQMALLGTMRAQQFAPVVAGEPLVVMGWGTGRSGRKIGAGSSLRTPQGRMVAVASAVWIVPA
jgi:hypothetical protein